MSELTVASEMLVESWAIDRVIPYEKNPRKNGPAVTAVATSIQEFGFRQPIVVDEHGVIIIGHTRRLAAMKLGLATVPVHVARGLDETKIRALRIADNKTAELAEWDKELLPLELKDLMATPDFDMDVLGFEIDELEKWMGAQISGSGGVVGADIDAVPTPMAPEAMDDAITQPGDIWILGNHRLMCGDSSSPEDLDKLLDGKRIHLVNTDPPYNVKVEPRSNNAIAAGLSSFGNAQDVANADAHKGLLNHQGFDLQRNPGCAIPTTRKMRAKDRPLANDFMTDADFETILLKWFQNMVRALEDGRSFYCWGGYANVANYPPAFKAAGLYFAQAIIWDKQHPVMTRKDFMGAHEWCFYGWKEGAAHYFNPEIHNAQDLWHVKKVNPQSMVHLTEKPVELAVLAMTYSSRPGENVLDLFGGSGSTMMGAEQCGRNAFSMEIDDQYCDIICERWCKYTGKEAYRVNSDGTKTSFNEEKENRKRKTADVSVV